MAFAKRFDCTYFSSNTTEYTLEIFADGWAGSSTAINLGPEGCEINYDADGQTKFTRIIASNMTIPFIVENASMALFITQLRTVYNERQVYAYLYATGTPADADNPLWAGYVLMDLGAEEDLSYPYEVKLKAVDGLGLLKNHDFVRSGSTLPYDRDDTFLPTNLSPAYRTFTHWIKIILEATGMATTDEGCVSNYSYQTAADWYNKDHPSSAPSQTDDPLALTQCRMGAFYTVNSDDYYDAKSYYDVLNAICKAWGMRCTYWNHKFHFVQVSLYKTAESGSLGSPENIDTRVYQNDGVLDGTQAFLGTTQFTRYELDFENVSSAGTGLQKLSGTQYTYYPIAKVVKADFASFSDVNYFNGFPLINPALTTGSFPVAVDTWYYMEEDIGIFTDANQLQGWYCKIPLCFQNLCSGGAKAMRYGWTIVAEEVSGSGAYELTTNSGVLSWQAYALPSTSQSQIYDAIYGFVQNIPTGLSVQILFDSGAFLDGIIPSHTDFTGEWSFKFQTRARTNDGTSGDGMWGHGGVSNPASTGAQGGFSSAYPVTTSTNPALQSNNLIYSNNSGLSVPATTTISTQFGNITIANPAYNPYSGTFIPVMASSIGTSSSLTTITTSSGSDSYVINLEDTMWGDAAVPTSVSGLRVYDGTNWAYAAATGDWAVNSTSGTLSFTQLLCEETLYNQSTVSLKLNGKSALAETDRLESGYIKFVNPIGRLKDMDNRFYVMLRGTFSTSVDEWNGEWFEQAYASTGYGSNQQDLPNEDGPNTGAVAGIAGGNVSGWQANMGSQNNMGNSVFAVTHLNATIAGGSAFTEVGIDKIVDGDGAGVARLKSGDVVQVVDSMTGIRTDLTLTADQQADDTTLTVVETDLVYRLSFGSAISISDLDLIQQYQNKTSGTIAGISVDADSIGIYAYKTGLYEMAGVDLYYKKILPRDFMVNEDVSPAAALEFKDASNTGLQVGDADQEMIATVNIPSGLTATEVYIWGSVTTKVVEVYAMSISANGKTSIGSGTTNGVAIDITDTAGTDTNYLMIIVKVTATSNRIYGGKVTMAVTG